MSPRPSPRNAWVGQLNAYGIWTASVLSRSQPCWAVVRRLVGIVSASLELPPPTQTHGSVMLHEGCSEGESE